MPDVAVEIVEAALVHEADVMWFSELAATCRYGFVDEVIDLDLTVKRQVGQDFGGLMRIGDDLRRGLLELRMGQQHRVDVGSDNQTRSRFVGEFRMEREADGPEKRSSICRGR